jgi:hypothetical protein
MESCHFHNAEAESSKKIPWFFFAGDRSAGACSKAAWPSVSGATGYKVIKNNKLLLLRPGHGAKRQQIPVVYLFFKKTVAECCAVVYYSPHTQMRLVF